MAFRYKRQERYYKLLASGMLPFEAKNLSELYLTSIVWIKQMLKDRRVLKRQAIKEDWTKAKYVAAIRQEYVAKDWVDKRGKSEAWKMARFYRDLYRDKHPEYDSPNNNKRTTHHNKQHESLNRTKILEQKRQYREKNRDKISAKARIYRQNRKERGY